MELHQEDSGEMYSPDEQGECMPEAGVQNILVQGLPDVLATLDPQVTKGWYHPSSYFWESTTPSPSFDVSVSRRNGFSKLRNTGISTICIVHFKTLTASHASGDSCTWPILTSLPSTPYKGFARWKNPLMKCQ